MTTDIAKKSISALALLPVGILQNIVLKLDYASLSNLTLALGREVSVNQWSMIKKERSERRLFSALPPEIYQEIVSHMDSPSIHALIHALRPSRDIRWLVRVLLYWKAFLEYKVPMMHWAADIGCKECLSYYKHEYLYEMYSMEGFTPLTVAAYKGHEEIVWDLLTEYGYSGMRKADTNETALILACDAGHKTIAEMLFMWGADPHEFDDNDRTALSVATSRNHLGIMKMLIDGGARMDTYHGPVWGTPLDIAVDCGYPDAVELLLRSGAKPVHTGNAGISLSTMERALMYKGNAHWLHLNKHPQQRPPPITVQDTEDTRLKIVSLLCQYKINLNTIYGPRDATVMHLAASNLAANVIKVLCGQNMGMINTLDPRGSSPLHLAALKAKCVDDLEMFEALLKHGVDWTIRDSRGRTAMDRVPRKLWCEAYKIFGARLSWYEDVGNMVAYYTWYGFYSWARKTWIHPILWALSRAYPEQYNWTGAFVCSIPQSAVYLSLASILNAIRGSLPVRLMRKLLRGIVDIVQPVIVSHLNDIRGLTAYQCLTSRFNTRFFWKVFYASCILMHLVVIFSLNLGGGPKLKVNGADRLQAHERGGANGVCLKNQRH
jgi:ankyrin repeat protein